jgi:uncharacterized repeat protein (TIGR01451 family)
MKSELGKRFVLILMAVLSGGAVFAQEQSTLDVTTTVQKELVETNADGETTTRLVPAETVIPGERVIYTTTFRNVGTDPADNVVITNPLSESLAYVDGSAFGPGMTLEFSVDGGASFGTADALFVEDADGERPARGEDYTHLRWTLNSSLAAGAQGVVRFTAVLE